MFTKKYSFLRFFVLFCCASLHCLVVGGTRRKRHRFTLRHGLDGIGLILSRTLFAEGLARDCKKGEGNGREDLRIWSRIMRVDCTSGKGHTWDILSRPRGEASPDFSQINGDTP